MHEVLKQKVVKLTALLEEYAEEVDFGVGVSVDRIQEAETRLQVRFPDSYKWWLETFGTGTIYGDEIYGIYQSGFDAVAGGDVVYMNELIRKRGHYPSKHLFIFKTDQGESYFLDLSEVDKYGESCVYTTAGSNTAKYAQNFLEFLENQLVNN